MELAGQRSSSNRGAGLDAYSYRLFSVGLPKNSAHPNLGKLFVAFIASKEAQAILQKYESRSSHLVEGTMMGKYLQENRIKVLDAKQQNDFYLQGEAAGLKLKEELAKIMKQ